MNKHNKNFDKKYKLYPHLKFRKGVWKEIVRYVYKEDIVPRVAPAIETADVFGELFSKENEESGFWRFITGAANLALKTAITTQNFTHGNFTVYHLSDQNSKSMSTNELLVVSESDYWISKLKPDMQEEGIKRMANFLLLNKHVIENHDGFEYMCGLLN